MDKSQEILFKRYILNISYIIISYFVLGYFLFNIDTHLRSYFLVASFVHLVGIVIFHIIPVVYIRKTLNIYFIVLFITLYSQTVFDLIKGSTDMLIWWIPTLTTMYAVYPGKKGVQLAGWYFILALSAFVVVFVLRRVLYYNAPLAGAYSFPLVYVVRAGIIHTVCALLIVWLGLRYIYMFYQMKIEQLSDPAKTGGSDNLLNMNKEEYKYERIYIQIEKYFEMEQPYLDADFSLSRLSNSLNINHVYLSKAIVQKKNMNFNSLVNSYRIAHVKKLIQDNSHRYTLQYIYLASGFKSQPTFNKAFKDMEGVTPSEYYKKFAKKKDIT